MRIKQLDIPCLSYQCGNPSDGYEYDCEYENSCDFSCDECVCNFGDMNPITGKRINPILRHIQNKRAIKYYKNREEQDRKYKQMEVFLHEVKKSR